MNEVSSGMYAAIYPVYTGAGSEKLNVKILRVTPSPSSRLTTNVVASGNTIHDSKVVMPTEISCDVVLEKRNADFEATRNKIYDMWRKKTFVGTDEFAAVRTKDGMLYKNLVLANCPHTEDAEHYDTFIFQLKFQEFMFSSTKGYEPAVAADS